jgi:ATP-dependent helicase HrpB
VRAELPVDDWIPSIVAAVRTRRAAVVVAAPGAGKTTRVPPALVDDGRVLLLQPRRVAARSIARRIAEERGWTLGREVGWHVRFERRFTDQTRLIVATEGILTARLQQDPLLTDIQTIVIDEFHERSIHADLGIALAKQAWTARDDLRIIVMSATLDAAQVAAYLDDAPIFDIPGRLHPIDIRYQPGGQVAHAVSEAIAATTGQVLCFLPGAGEVNRAVGEIGRMLPAVEVIPLHGSLPPEAQDEAVRVASRRRVIVATNIAETSLTVPGVTAVVDSGLHKIARYDPDRAIDSLDLARISRDSADQRAGRAGRTAPGVVRRLWDAADKLRPHREPDIRRIDLSGPALDILAWGGDPSVFPWFEAPDPAGLSAALELLGMLGAVDRGKLTDVGRAMGRLPVHPRLARILIEGRGARDVALACAVLSDRQLLPRHPPATTSDLLDAVDRERDLPAHVVRTAGELQRVAGGKDVRLNEAAFRRALFAGYPDRVAQRRTAGQPRVLLSSGHGAVIGPESGVRDADYLVAIDVQSGRRGEQSEARIRIASAIEKEWLSPTDVTIAHEFDASGKLRGYEREMYGAVLLKERLVAVDASQAAQAMADAFLARPLNEAHEQLARRVQFAGLSLDLREVAVRAATAARRVEDIDLASALEWTTRQALERAAPASFVAPSGRTHRLHYDADGTVSASIKLQELFGLAESPAIGPRRVPLRLLLLAPNGRPVQTTSDLRSFWDRTYPEVRKELRGRYPKHPWPDDPWTATPTARATRRRE